MMDCESFKALVHEVDRQGCFEASVLDLAWGHAQNCARCARRLARARELTTALGALAKADEREGAPMRLEAQLLSAFRVDRKRVRSSQRRKLAWWMDAAAALAVMIAAGLAWHRLSVSQQARGRARAVAAIPSEWVAPNPPQATPTAPASQSGDDGHNQPSRTLKRAAPAREPEPVTELAEFLPLPFADDDSPLGTAEVVRIRLSESTLGVLGLPVSDEASRQPVTADVVIGEDGVARAIRFVSGPVPSEVVQQLQTMAFESKGANP